MSGARTRAGEGDGEGDGDGDGDADGDGDGEGSGEDDGEDTGEGEGDGEAGGDGSGFAWLGRGADGGLGWPVPHAAAKAATSSQVPGRARRRAGRSITARDRIAAPPRWGRILPDGRRAGEGRSKRSPASQVIDPSARIHPTADIEPGAEIGPATAVWHRAQVREGARLGAGCVVGKDVFIDRGVRVGDRVKIQNGALLYHGLTVEDGVFIGPGAILTNDRSPRAVTTTGDLVGEDDWLVGPITLRRGASLGAGAIVVAGCEVGEYAMVGAGAVVTHPVLTRSLVVGNPGRRIGWVCDCGRRLADAASGEPAPPGPTADAELVCGHCERVYRYVPDPEGVVPLAGGRPVSS